MSPTPGGDEDLRAVIGATPALVLRARPDGLVDFINRAWLEFTGLPSEQLLGLGWRAAIHPEDVETLVEEWCAALVSTRPFERARLRRADGEYRWFGIRVAPVRDDHETSLGGMARPTTPQNCAAPRENAAGRRCHPRAHIPSRTRRPKPIHEPTGSRLHAPHAPDDRLTDFSRPVSGAYCFTPSLNALRELAV